MPVGGLLACTHHDEPGMQSKAAAIRFLHTAHPAAAATLSSLPLVLAGATEVANLQDDLNYLHFAIAAASIRNQVVSEI